MATLNTLNPNADGTQTSISYSSGTTANNLISDASDTSWVSSGIDSSGTCFVDMSTTDTDFESILTLTYAIRSQHFGTRTDDNVNLYIQVFAADETTNYTDEINVDNYTSGAQNSFTDYSGSFTVNATGLAANKTSWDACRLRIRWVYTKTKASDGISIRVAKASLGGTYTPASAPINLTGAACTQGNSSASGSGITIEHNPVGATSTNANLSSDGGGITQIQNITGATSTNATLSSSGGITVTHDLRGSRGPALFTDNFESYSLGTLGSPWVQQGDIALNVEDDAGDKVVGMNVAQRGLNYNGNITHNADQWAQVTIQSVGGTGNQNGGVALRIQTGAAQGNEQAYLFRTGNAGTKYQIGIYDVNSTYGVVTESSVIPVAGDVLRAQIVGDELSLFVNNKLIATKTRTNFSSGQPGIYIFGADQTGDDYSSGNMGDFQDNSCSTGEISITTTINLTGAACTQANLSSAGSVTQNHRLPGATIQNYFNDCSGAQGGFLTQKGLSNWRYHGDGTAGASGNSGTGLVTFTESNQTVKDQYAQATIVTIDASAYTVLLCRVEWTGNRDNSNKGYGLAWGNGGNYLIVKYTGGNNQTFSTLSDTGVAASTSDVVRFEVSGTTLTAFRNGSQIGQTTDSDYKAGFTGFGAHGTTAKVDDISVGNIGTNNINASLSSANAINQEHNIVFAACIQANLSSDGGGIVLALDLLGSPCSQANLSSAGAIDQEHNVVGATSTNANLSSAGVITQTVTTLQSITTISEYTDNFSSYTPSSNIADDSKWDAWDTDSVNLVIESASGLEIEGGVTNRNDQGIIIASSYQTFSNDQYAQISQNTGSSNHLAGGPIVRGGSSTQRNGYVFHATTNAQGENRASIFKYINDVETIIVTAGLPFNPVGNTVHVLKLVVIGTNLYGYVDGKLVIQGSDSSIASGQPGYRSWYTGRADDFIAGSVLDHDTIANASSTGTIDTNQTLVAAACDQANLSSTGAISQEHNVVGATSTQANLSSGAVITQIQELVGATSTQANFSATGIVDEEINLAGAPCSQANFSSAGAITQVHIIGVTGIASTQANLSSTGAITSDGDLLGAACTQANLSSSGAITQNHDIVGAISTQANQSSGGILTQIQEMIGASAIQVNISSIAAITQDHVIVGAGVIQLNSCTTGEVSGDIDLLTDLNTQTNNSASVAITKTHNLHGASCWIYNWSYQDGITQIHILQGTSSIQANESEASAVFATGTLTGPDLDNLIAYLLDYVPTAAQISEAVLQKMLLPTTIINANIKEVNDIPILGLGTAENPWGPVP